MLYNFAILIDLIPRIRVFSARSMKPLAVLCYHRDSIYSIDFGAHGNWLMAASKDRRISLWNLF